MLAKKELQGLCITSIDTAQLPATSNFPLIFPTTAFFLLFQQRANYAKRACKLPTHWLPALVIAHPIGRALLARECEQYSPDAAQQSAREPSRRRRSTNSATTTTTTTSAKNAPNALFLKVIAIAHNEQRKQQWEFPTRRKWGPG